jgi:hypothetical protein
MERSGMKWFDEIAQGITYPLRATGLDKALMIIQASIVIALAVFGIATLISWLCA